jgi:hypothetical protein
MKKMLSLKQKAEREACHKNRSAFKKKQKNMSKKIEPCLTRHGVSIYEQARTKSLA